uniref:Bgt_avrF2_22 n=1 Tax=Blumeria graminis f. sp. tritici 96224 TaxID=1268274 RepID=A0A381LF97_BLUGR
MKNLSLISIVVFLSNLMPALANQDYLCNGLPIKWDEISDKVDEKYNELIDKTVTKVTAIIHDVHYECRPEERYERASRG